MATAMRDDLHCLCHLLLALHRLQPEAEVSHRKAVVGDDVEDMGEWTLNVEPVEGRKWPCGGVRRGDVDVGHFW
ncbi:hypothetical protein FIBSPDRAFT_869338 [Athelia psychrophila]|uniref:Uncharacterized protein n=1 Tax=Athelia psychrophila TaxID=1759441 RepID=A0A166CC76_9AGAM|nr:hypothetical protein FIBSPDRAFT_869338 [Fibularhizoctonia sp. CBS 109695]